MSHNPVEASALRYRIVYDALVKFSCNINKCENEEAVVQCMNTDLKYLFDCIGLRFCIDTNTATRTVCYSRYSELCDAMQNIQLPFEKEALGKDMPLAIEKADIRQWAGNYFPANILDETNLIWVWPFRFNENQKMTVTILSGPKDEFRRSDIPILKIVSETFYAKMNSLQLFEEILRTKNELQDVLEKVEIKNNEITELANKQELIIQQRTAQLKLRNEKLSEIVKFNAHNIREPLTRIAGLLELTRIITDKEIIDDVLPMMRTTVADLDDALKNVILYIENE